MWSLQPLLGHAAVVVVVTSALTPVLGLEQDLVPLLEYMGWTDHVLHVLGQTGARTKAAEGK